MTRRTPVIIGLTGSIGMGKSATARLFAEAGVPVWDADSAVHKLYGPRQAGSLAIGQLFPAAVGPEGVDRKVLQNAILEDPTLLPMVERAVHPLVFKELTSFLSCYQDEPLVVLDVPLLFETSAENTVDKVVVVSAPESVQRERVLARPVMGLGLFESIRARQMSDDEKRARADYIIYTHHGLDYSREAVLKIIEDIKGLGDAGNCA